MNTRKVEVYCKEDPLPQGGLTRRFEDKELIDKLNPEQGKRMLKHGWFIVEISVPDNSAWLVWQEAQKYPHPELNFEMRMSGDPRVIGWKRFPRRSSKPCKRCPGGKHWGPAHD